MIIATIVFIIFSNLYMFLYTADMTNLAVPATILIGIPFALLNVFPSFSRFPVKRLLNIKRGTNLLIEFLVTVTVDAGVLMFMLISGNYEAKAMWLNSIGAVICGNIIFWNGILRVYLSAHQLGIKWRVIGLLCGMIPIAHLVVLGIIIGIATREYRDETARYKLNKAREEDQVCKTRYPLLMVHGVFFRDRKSFNYWGRIPEDLEKNGAVVYYGNQQSAESVADSGKHLAERIKQIAEETGCGKVNVIAHSKGGLDARCAITMWGAAPYVASLTTINSPHRGCQFADYILGKAPDGLLNAVAGQYNGALRKLGDTNPDFISAVKGLTHDACTRFNEECPDSPEVYYQSVGSKSVSASGGRFPLNLSYQFVKHFDGPNDGLVSVPSMEWGSNFVQVFPKKNRGITHGDMIDLNRENIDGFDVRETYVQMVSNLKERGL